MNKLLSNKFTKKLLPKTVNNPGGFTLVELLVTISILAILAIIGFALFQDAQKRARDARRRGEIQAIANAWEVNYNENNASYPTPLTPAMFSGGGIPSDPLNGQPRCTTGTSATAGTTCEYCYRTSAGNCDGNTANRITSTTPAAASFPNGITSWYVCTNLEKPNLTANPPEFTYYCRANQR